MIRVNLLVTSPGASQPRVLVSKEQRPAMIGLTMLLVTGLGVGGWWYYINQQRAATETGITTAETRLEQLKDAMKLLESARQHKAELEERISLIERLRSAKHAPVRMLDLMNESMTDGLWLLEIKQTASTVQIEGRAMSHTSITDFAQALQVSGFFKMPVEIVTTMMEAVDQANVIRFVLKAEPAAGPAVPATGAAGATVAGRPGA
ncbi:MAG TPA: PilN domain-containing protein [Vicinamibacterales bacterium]|nr:PilN domain-containing protein [Vicinamibacterales bacterium]